jgi:hypothetical protein
MSLQNPIEFALKMPQFSPGLQDSLTKGLSSIAPHFLRFEKKEIAMERHPLQTLYHLIERARGGEAVSDLQQKLDAVPESLRNAVYFEVLSIASETNKGGDKWGERNAPNNPERLLKAIDTVMEKALDRQPQKMKNAIFGTIYRMGGQPATADPKWGETHAKEDPVRLIRSLHRHHCLETPGKEISVYADLEKGIATPSCTFHLYRKELARGQIGLHNGMGCSYDAARWCAYRMSDESAQGYNIHASYSATVNQRWDFASAILGQGGTATPPVVQLLEQWLDFAEKCDHDRLLQLCTSRGAIEVHNALKLLPDAVRQRIIVITIAPACLIPAELAYKVVNLIVPSDPVVQVAANRHLLDSPHTVKLPPHNNNQNPHDLFGSSYRDRLRPMIDQYIRTNDIEC